MSVLGYPGVRFVLEEIFREGIVREGVARSQLAVIIKPWLKGVKNVGICEMLEIESCIRSITHAKIHLKANKRKKNKDKTS